MHTNFNTNADIPEMFDTRLQVDSLHGPSYRNNSNTNNNNNSKTFCIFLGYQ